MSHVGNSELFGLGDVPPSVPIPRTVFGLGVTTVDGIENDLAGIIGAVLGGGMVYLVGKQWDTNPWVAGVAGSLIGFFIGKYAIAKDDAPVSDSNALEPIPAPSIEYEPIF